MDDMTAETIFIQQFSKHGYEIRTEVTDNKDQSRPPTTMRNAYTLPGGAYIGDFKAGQHLCEQMGIKPELVSSEISICTIGFCEREQKWYGWGNNKMAGFGIGTSATYQIDKPEQEQTPDDTTIEELPYRQRPLNKNTADKIKKTIEVVKTAKTLDEAKLMAVYFAESVA